MADDAKYPTRIAPYGLRLEPDLKARIQKSADSHGRSLQAELVQVLERNYPKPTTASFSIATIYELLRANDPSAHEAARDLVLNVISRDGDFFIETTEDAEGQQDITVHIQPRPKALSMREVVEHMRKPPSPSEEE